MVKMGTVFMKEQENAYSSDQVKCEPQSFSPRGDSTNISLWGGFGLVISSIQFGSKRSDKLDFFCHFLNLTRFITLLTVSCWTLLYIKSTKNCQILKSHYKIYWLNWDSRTHSCQMNGGAQWIKPLCGKWRGKQKIWGSPSLGWWGSRFTYPLAICTCGAFHTNSIVLLPLL